MAKVTTIARLQGQAKAVLMRMLKVARREQRVSMVPIAAPIAHKTSIPC